jgi:hypothetical protein
VGCNRPVSTPASDPASEPASRASDSPADPVEFALAPALRARLLGSGMVAIGTVVVLGVLLSWLTDLPAAVVSGLVALALVGVVALGLLVGVRHWVVRLDADGYRVRVLRSAQARSARWSDVLDVQAVSEPGNRCVVLRLRDGRTTTLPVDLIEGDPAVLTQALADHLDRGHGYRRLR